jgi:hypothetical protein
MHLKLKLGFCYLNILVELQNLRLIKHGMGEDIRVIFIALGGEAGKGCNLCLANLLQQKNVEERSSLQ